MTQEQNRPIFELRQYEIKAGQLDRWVDWMDTILIPFQRSVGMVVIGSWSVRETNHYIWIRRFESESERKRLYAAVYESNFWKNTALPIVGEMLDREVGRTITDMVASPLSIIR
ncbi:MAG: NIPSNAP family protein [Candidatus Promineifilaceae bacterium]